MNNEQKAEQLVLLIVKNTYPKDQFGFYNENNLYQDILKILNS